ncbi:MAG: DUF3375 domain-containing protein [Proteobacteria bacterium]|nr:MAG: DUF3375 domain-containing protein [Pseudomonadota bacterium]
MTFDELSIQFKSSRPLIILRMKSAPLMLSFFYKVFVESRNTTISNTELKIKLESYLEDLEYNEKDEELVDNTLFDDYGVKSSQYIEKWSNSGFLRKYPNDDGVDLHELTPDTSKVLTWLENIQQREFIGTNSRFRDIFFKLKEIIEKANEDVESRISELERKKWEIENEINLLKLGKKPLVIDDTEIKEQFYDLNRAARELLSDFTEVEQNFDAIRKEVQIKYLDRDLAKGTVLLYALEALEEIENKDQGKSFKAFWEFLMDESRQEEFASLTYDLYALLDERDIEYNNDRFLKNLKRYLHASGRKVVDSNRRLSEKLSRILTEKSALERRKIIELVNEIRQNAYLLIEHPIREDAFLQIEVQPHVNLFDRWELYDFKESQGGIKYPDQEEDSIELAEIKNLFGQLAIDREKLVLRINQLLDGRSQVSLREVVEKFGLKEGLAELVGYFSIAASSDGHVIIEETYDPIVVGSKKVNVPMVLFLNSSYNGVNR